VLERNRDINVNVIGLFDPQGMASKCCDIHFDDCPIEECTFHLLKFSVVPGRPVLSSPISPINLPQDHWDWVTWSL